MKKVTNITLGGFVFAVENDAYEMFSAYFSAIEKKFAGNKEYPEISEDIENAIAEKFMSAGKDEKQAVTVALVEQVIQEMGTAEDVANEELTQEPDPTSSQAEQPFAHESTPRRLYRDTDDEIIAGVASGIARYFDIDPVIVRLLFVISLFFNGFGFLAYIILWVIVPAATTTEQKYAMRGDRVTLSEISEQVKKNIQSIDEQKNIERAKGAWARVRSFLHTVFDLLGKMIRVLFRIGVYVVGFAFLLLGAFGIAGLVSSVSILWLGEQVWIRPEIQELIVVILSHPAGYFFASALFVSLFIPLLVSIMVGGSLLSGKNLFTLIKTITLGVVWVVAVTLAVTLGVLYQPISSQMEQAGVLEKHGTFYRYEISPHSGSVLFEVQPQ